MQVSALLAVGVVALWLHLPFGALLASAPFIFALFLLKKRNSGFFLSQVFVASSLYAFAYAFPFGIVALAGAALALFLMWRFGTESFPDAPPKVARVRLLLWFGLFLWAASFMEVSSFANPFLTFIAVFGFFLAALFAAERILSAEDALAARTEQPLLRRIFALSAALGSVELFLFVLFSPFPPGAQAVLVAAGTWVLLEVLVALRTAPLAIARIMRAGALGATGLLLFMVSAPWPAGIFRY